MASSCIAVSFHSFECVRPVVHLKDKKITSLSTNSSFFFKPTIRRPSLLTINAVADEKDTKEVPVDSVPPQKSPDEVTKKWGLEAGLWNVFTKKDAEGKNKTSEAAKLLSRYGSAYLITSISLSIVSFSLCYELVSIGVDVNSLLEKVGIHSNNSETIGTFALAYAAHKAASPIRFPPTVALTPIVANLIGKKIADTESKNE